MQQEDCLALLEMLQTNMGAKIGYGDHRLPEKQSAVMHGRHAISCSMMVNIVVTSLEITAL